MLQYIYHRFLAVSTITGCIELSIHPSIHPIPCPHLHQHNIPPIYMLISTQTSTLFACSSMLSHLSSISLHLSFHIATQIFYLHTPGNRLLLRKLLPSLVFHSSVLNTQKITECASRSPLLYYDCLIHYSSHSSTQSTYLIKRRETNQNRYMVPSAD
jgi:hypothetical protein